MIICVHARTRNTALSIRLLLAVVRPCWSRHDLRTTDNALSAPSKRVICFFFPSHPVTVAWTDVTLTSIRFTISKISTSVQKKLGLGGRIDPKDKRKRKKWNYSIAIIRLRGSLFLAEREREKERNTGYCGKIRCDRTSIATTPIEKDRKLVWVNVRRDRTRVAKRIRYLSRIFCMFIHIHTHTHVRVFSFLRSHLHLDTSRGNPTEESQKRKKEKK